MMSKTTIKEKRRRTTMAPVTTVEEIPVLSETERADLLASLQEAEARVEAGQAVDYDPGMFKQRLVGLYRGAKR
jgi:hypothetical protein